MMKTIKLEDLKTPKFHFEGLSYTLDGLYDFTDHSGCRLLATADETQRYRIFNAETKVQIEDDDFNTKDLTDDSTDLKLEKEFGEAN